MVISGKPSNTENIFLCVNLSTIMETASGMIMIASDCAMNPRSSRSRIRYLKRKYYPIALYATPNRLTNSPLSKSVSNITLLVTHQRMALSIACNVKNYISRLTNSLVQPNSNIIRNIVRSLSNTSILWPTVIYEHAISKDTIALLLGNIMVRMPILMGNT
jgi:hypothetical protein